MSSPFQDALSEIQGRSWLAQAARSSLQAADAKFGHLRREPLLRVELVGSRRLGAADTATVSLALQAATAKLGHVILDPTSERLQSRRKDWEEALLIPKAQLGRTMYFAFPADDSELQLEGFSELPRRPSLSEAAIMELCSVLPGSSEDDSALDALVSQRSTVRSAVSDIVQAVTEVATGLTLDLSVLGDTAVHSEMTVDQAEVLADSFRETRTDRREERMTGRLDGVRTRRRIFYLELETGAEIHGAIGPDAELMDLIRENLDRVVLATIVSERVETMDGKRGRPVYRLVGLEPAPSLFD